MNFSFIPSPNLNAVTLSNFPFAFQYPVQLYQSNHLGCGCIANLSIAHVRAINKFPVLIRATIKNNVLLRNLEHCEGLSMISEQQKELKTAIYCSPSLP